MYLLHEPHRLLLMEAELGLPAWGVKPWTRVRIDADVPVAAAARRGELVWVPGPDDLARRFPATAVSVPYAFALAAAPIRNGANVRGSWVLMWPESHPARLSPAELAAIGRTSGQLGQLLADAEDSGHPLRSIGQPRAVTTPFTTTPDEQQATAALNCLDRFTDGVAAINLEGHITFCNPAAAGLLGLDGSPVRGSRLWDRVPWLRDPVFEDRCRAAVIGQQPASWTAHAPGGRLLEIRLHPAPSGITLHITETGQNGHDQDVPAGTSIAEALPLGDSRNFLHIASTLTRALDVREVVNLVADHVAPVYDVQAMALLVPEGGRMRIVGSLGYTREALERLDGLPVTSSTPAEQAMRTGLPAYFSTWEELQSAHPDAVRHENAAAWAFLPLTVAEQRIGTCALAFTHPHRFTPEERVTLSALAGLIAQALDRALLYEIKDRLAHTLQTALLPAALPPVPGLQTAARYVPATRGVGIGGDFYDLINPDGGVVAAVIGDVQGHNIRAAALMGQVRTAIRAYTVTGASPGEVLQHANRLLVDLGTDLFTSCLLVHVDLRLRTFCAASAGHPPPLLCLPGRHTDVIDVPAGPLLGVDPDAEYPTQNVPFPPQAVLALYTDGLVEEPGLDVGDGIDALARHLAEAGDEPLRQLTDTLLGHAPPARRHADDIAVLLLKHDPS
ncbi:MAG: SpoIIE family protein phosphatase [Nonomuraea sp.]|nr:SpoIIE family protein phosphatase [Nonomuraea sp.]